MKPSCSVCGTLLDHKDEPCPNCVEGVRTKSNLEDIMLPALDTLEWLCRINAHYRFSIRYVEYTLEKIQNLLEILPEIVEKIKATEKWCDHQFETLKETVDHYPSVSTPMGSRNGGGSSYGRYRCKGCGKIVDEYGKW